MSDEVVLTRVGRKYFSRRVIMLTENYVRNSSYVSLQKHVITLTRKLTPTRNTSP
jgi:hypothetical protein